MNRIIKMCSAQVVLTCVYGLFQHRSDIREDLGTAYILYMDTVQSQKYHYIHSALYNTSHVIQTRI